MMTVKNLMEMLSKLNPETLIYTAGEEGIFPMEEGNLMPLKFFAGRLYVDDGLCVHPQISEKWIPLDEHVSFLQECLH